MNGLYISGVNFESMADGEGVRTTIFFSGCPHHCPGCHNPEAQNPTNGVIAYRYLDHIVSEYEKRAPFLSGITLSGGDPFYSALAVAEFVDMLREQLEIPSIWAYTGYLYEELVVNKSFMTLLNRVDVLIDGPFIQNQRDITLRWRGSTNQRIIDVKKSLNNERMVLWNEN